MKKIEEYRAILADRKLLLGVIRKEILVISENTEMKEELISAMMNLTFRWRI